MSMFTDSLGNRYGSLPTRKPTPGAKPSKGGVRKYGRNRVPRSGLTWQQKVHGREARHAALGHRFTRYPC